MLVAPTRWPRMIASSTERTHSSSSTMRGPGVTNAFASSANCDRTLSIARCTCLPFVISAPSLERPGQLRNRRRDRPARIAAEPHYESGARRRLHIKPAHGTNDDTPLACGALDRGILEAALQIGDEMH